MIGVGWATVELDRAVHEHAPDLRPGATFRTAPDSELLGARCLVGALPDDHEASWLVLLEPSTEGRLAATLARHGEGWVATWIEAGARSDDRSGPPWTVARPGPLGRERLVLDGPPTGPHRLLVSSGIATPRSGNLEGASGNADPPAATIG